MPIDPKDSKVSSSITIVPSVFTGKGKDGDFGWMLNQDIYNDAFFIFNDNESQFLTHQKDATDVNGCAVGEGNAIARPFQCTDPPRAGGIPTGDGYVALTDHVKSLIDMAIKSIKKIVTENGYKRIIFSANSKGELGTKIFNVGDDVKKYIVTQIHTLGK